MFPVGDIEEGLHHLKLAGYEVIVTGEFEMMQSFLNVANREVVLYLLPQLLLLLHGQLDQAQSSLHHLLGQDRTLPWLVGCYLQLCLCLWLWLML